MKIDAIFFDFDGTLHPFGQDSIPKSTQEALKKLDDNGIKIFIATGRIIDLIPYFDDITISGYVTSNGSIVCDKNRKTIYEKYFDPKDIIRLIQYIKENPFTISTQDGAILKINHISDNFKEISQRLRLKNYKVMDIENLLKGNITQMNIFVDEKLEQHIVYEVMKEADSSRWTPLFADVNPKGISKWEGIKYFLNELDIDPKKTMAFGDGGNDRTMIQNVAVGVAMGNANEELKNIADYVTTESGNDGIYNALKHYSLI